MPDSNECRRALAAALEEVALALGGVVATYPVPDNAIWDLARALDLIHERALARWEQGEVEQSAAVEGGDDTEHPAIVHLLRRLGARSGAGARRNRGAARPIQHLEDHR